MVHKFFQNEWGWGWLGGGGSSSVIPIRLIYEFATIAVMVLATFCNLVDRYVSE